MDQISGIRYVASAELNAKLPPWLEKFSFVKVNRVQLNRLKGSKISAHELFIEELQIVISNKQSSDSLQLLGEYLANSEYLTDLNLVLYHNENSQETAALLAKVLPTLKSLISLKIIIGMGNNSNMDWPEHLILALRNLANLQTFHVSFFQEFKSDELWKTVAALKHLKQLQSLAVTYGWAQKGDISKSIRELGNVIQDLPLLKDLSFIFESPSNAFLTLTEKICTLTSLKALTFQTTDTTDFTSFINDLYKLKNLDKLFLRINLSSSSMSSMRNLIDHLNLKQISLEFSKQSYYNYQNESYKDHFSEQIRQLSHLTYYSIDDYHFKKQSLIIRNCKRLVIYNNKT